MRGWMAFVERLGRFQTALVLFLTYTLVLGPISMLIRGIGRQDLLELKRTEGSSFAHAKKAVPTDRERCERQF
jgi:hypothetical protein